MKEYADKVLLSHTVFTAETKRPFDGGVAVKGNKISGVGTKSQMSSLIGPDTEILDFGDRLIIPGFCDSHLHLIMGGMASLYVDLAEGRDEEETAALVKKHFDKHPELFGPDDWVIGFNWYHFRWEGQRPPTKASLDSYFPDRPVFLLNGDCHGAWVNSCALQLCGIDSATPDVTYGIIHKDDYGEPTGYLEEAAMSLCMKEAIEISDDKQEMLLHLANDFLSKNGITSINDMQPVFGANVGDADVYKKLADKGELDFRVNFATDLFADQEKNLDYKRRFADSESQVYYIGLKQFIDGIVTTHTGDMLSPYADKPDLNHRFNLLDISEASERIKFYQGKGISIHLHAVGDGAVRTAVDMYEAAISENGQNEARLSIEHLDLTTSEDRERIGRLGIIASVQPQHLTLSETLETNDYPKVVGAEREKNLWAFRSLQDSGAKLAFGTDYPVVNVNPFLGLHRAVTRRFSDERPIEGWNPQEKISLADALIAYTQGGAYMCGKENVVGTLTKGKLADITVMDRNLFNSKPEELTEATIVFTMMNGRVVYSSSNE